MAVRYYTDDCTYRLPQKRLTAAWLDRVAREEGYELGDVTYIFCSAARLLDMNRQFLGHDYYTDVITFDYSDRKGARIVSGDIFIDVETVADNAREYGAAKLTEIPTGTRVSKSVSTTNTLSRLPKSRSICASSNSLPTASRPPHSPRWCATAWKKAFWCAAPYRKRLPHS